MRSVRYIALGSATLALWSSAVWAQACDIPRPPFPLAPARQLKGDAIARAVSGKTAMYERIFRDDRGKAWENRHTRQFRPDGSARFTCEVRNVGETDWQRCAYVQVQGQREPANADVGVWRATENALCYTFTFLAGGTERCAAIYRDRNQYYVKSVSGQGDCFYGPVVFK